MRTSNRPRMGAARTSSIGGRLGSRSAKLARMVASLALASVPTASRAAKAARTPARQHQRHQVSQTVRNAVRRPGAGRGDWDAAAAAGQRAGVAVPAGGLCIWGLGLWWAQAAAEGAAGAAKGAQGASASGPPIAKRMAWCLSGVRVSKRRSPQRRSAPTRSSPWPNRL